MSTHTLTLAQKKLVVAYASGALDYARATRNKDLVASVKATVTASVIAVELGIITQAEHDQYMHTVGFAEFPAAAEIIASIIG